MRPDSKSSLTRVRVVHPYAWLWEPLEPEPTFLLRAMFGAKAVYLGGRMMFCFSAGEEPWRGVLVCTDRERQPALQAEFPELVPHPILPKWLYLPERVDAFERLAQRLVTLARRGDPRLGIIPPAKKKKSSTARKTAARRRRDFKP